MSKELIERLRSGITLYSACLENGDKHMTLLSEAADLIEAQQKRIKELDRENKNACDSYIQAVDLAVNEWKPKLAAAQAQLKDMRDALENCRLIAARYRKEDWAQHVLRICSDAGVTGSPLRQEDDSALREMLKAERERCTLVCKEYANTLRGIDAPDFADVAETCANKIRAMGSE